MRQPVVVEWLEQLTQATAIVQQLPAAKRHPVAVERPDQLPQATATVQQLLVVVRQLATLEWLEHWSQCSSFQQRSGTP